MVINTRRLLLLVALLGWGTSLLCPLTLKVAIAEDEEVPFFELHEEAEPAASPSSSPGDELFPPPASPSTMLSEKTPKYGNKVMISVNVRWDEHCSGLGREYIQHDLRAGTGKEFVISLETLDSDVAGKVLGAKVIPEELFYKNFSVVFPVEQSREAILAGLYICSNSVGSADCAQAKVVNAKEKTKEDLKKVDSKEWKDDKIFYFNPIILKDGNLHIFEKPIGDESEGGLEAALEEQLGFNFANTDRAKALLSAGSELEPTALTLQGLILKLSLSGRPAKFCRKELLGELEQDSDSD